MALRRLAIIWIGVVLVACVAGAQTFDASFDEAGLDDWKPLFEKGNWQVEDGALVSTGDAAMSSVLAPVQPLRDVLVEARFQAGESERHNMGVVLRAIGGDTAIAVRYYDRYDCLEIIPYTHGEHGNITRTEQPYGLKPGTWWRIKALAVFDTVMAKLWPDGAAEPEWQLVARVEDRRPGGVGVHNHDGSRARFDDVHIVYGEDLKPVRDAALQVREAWLARVQEDVQLRVNVTPLVLRGDDAPRRQVNLEIRAGETPWPMDGELALSFGEFEQRYLVEAAQFNEGRMTLFLPEPEEDTPLKVSLVTEDLTLTWEGTVAPARHWVFYMTPHTHYDIGYTEPQDEVIARLTDDMRSAVTLVRETEDWPEESRFRWTVEVSGLMDRFIERNSPAVVQRFMEEVHAGGIEIAGFYLNMPTELTGHEELIRCLYSAQALRDQYGVTIDTIMIDDVPGYTWALPALLQEAGMPKAALRANSIRGQFLWDRPGAVPRPFYWEAPNGAKTFVWYTDSYREGNFFREPGLHEDAFIGIITRNERVGAKSDLIQLRMGGDNLPPDIDASKNARAWNERYLWPRVRVATNRAFLDDLEARYGADTPTYRGDIPSWWAEGPASTAKETAEARGLHDGLVATEGLATAAWLAVPGSGYPQGDLTAAWEHLLHFDEHTWGAHDSVDNPGSPGVETQWAWKRGQVEQAQAKRDAVERAVAPVLQSRLPEARGFSVAVWNPLGWPRMDVVALTLPVDLRRESGVAAVNRETGAAAMVQFDGDQAYFIAGNVPSLGYAVYDLRVVAGISEAYPVNSMVLENTVYRVRVDAESGQWVEWYDKRLDRNLLDTAEGLAMAHPVHESPQGDRDAINAKKPVRFDRTPAERFTVVDAVEGPAFSAITRTTSLPHAPLITQTVRLYHGIDRVYVINEVEKGDNVEPEGLYFAFPFDVPNPQFRMQIACASMRPGEDQLPLSCQDFYSVQQWVDIAGDGFGVLFAPIDAPLVTLSDWNVYQWADSLTFDRGYVYSLAMNNYWFTNFRASQPGQATIRYALSSYAGAQDPLRATHATWGVYYPLRAIPLRDAPPSGEVLPASLVTFEGDPVVMLVMKRAVRGNGVVVRLLEVRGEPAETTLTFHLPAGVTITGAHRADVVERPVEPLELEGTSVRLSLGANDIYTLRLDVERN